MIGSIPIFYNKKKIKKMVKKIVYKKIIINKIKTMI